MEVNRRTPTPLEGGLLGLLARGGALSGWDLQKQAETSIAYFWPFGRSQIYAALPRLELAGLVQGREVAQEGRPDKRLYRIREAGRDALADWLQEDAVGEFRDGFLLKIFFAAHADRSAVRDLIRRRRARAERLKDELGQMSDSPDIDDFFHRLTRDFGHAWAECLIQWCDEALSSLDALDHDRSTTWEVPSLSQGGGASGGPSKRSRV